MSEEKQTPNYKETLNLPKTSFSMKANLSQREPAMLKQWQEEDLYGKIRSKSAGKKTYVLHDGPPYANGKIHIGHALNKILKDIIVRFKTMQGRDSLYVPGWDCHGLPIEHQCLKDMGKRKDQVERVPFRKQARKYAEKFIGVQREDFKRLGIFGEWEKPYLTMNFGYQAAIADSFLRLAEKDFIYQGLKPVPWCFDCETALADAELEYQDKTSKSVYVKFSVDLKSFEDQIDTQKKINPDGKPVYLLVWTTTPWTLPANVGAAIHPDLQYVVRVLADEVWIFAEARLSHLESSEFGQGAAQRSSIFKGALFQGLKYNHPFLERQGRVILADYVSATDGTGIVHIAPGHGEDDYQYGHVENRLDVISPVNEKGLFTFEFGTCEGTHVFKANEKIAEILKTAGLLLAEEAYRHSYPHCWRCKKPIIFRATKQWFMKIDHRDLRGGMMEAIDAKIRFTPEWGKRRIGSMVATRPEWCLSRQRYWGVPIPMIGCVKCPGRFFAAEVRAKVKELFEREGADSWFTHAAGDFLPEGFQCPNCGGGEFSKEDDIIDVWFDSGVSHQAVLKADERLGFPADLYLEGSDQHRGWFQSSLTTALALENRPPFEGVLTHGFVVDGEGKKMSKSAGNVVAPQDVMKEYGADILRLWVSSVDYQYDIRLSKDILKQLADSYRKIRNTFRYMLANLFDFDPSKDALQPAELDVWDRWAVGRTNEIIADVVARYERFEFHQIYNVIHLFCVSELSGYYFDGLKDILYTYGKDSKRRRSAQTAIHYILKRLVKVLAPILPFTMEEVWRSFALEPGVESVHISDWDAADQWEVEEKKFRIWQLIKRLREAVTPALEKKREEKLIGAGLEAQIAVFTADPQAAEVLQTHLSVLPQVFVVSEVVWLTDPEGADYTSNFTTLEGTSGELHVRVRRADGKKCERCWIYSPAVGADPQHPGLCGKCREAVS